MNKFLEKYLAWIICILSFIGFAAILIKYHNNMLISFDNNIYNFISGLRNDLLTSIFKVVTYLGESKVILLALILLIVFTKKKRIPILLALCSISSFGINFFIKHIVKRPRPTWGFLISEDGYSFLSNHSLAMMTFYGLILYYIWKSNINKNYKILWTVLITITIIIIPISRIYLGVHYPSDVIAGLLFGLSYLIAFINLVYKKTVRK